MQWKDDYKIGIPVIDAQHKQLFLATNELSEAQQGPDPCRHQQPADPSGVLCSQTFSDGGALHDGIILPRPL